MLLEALAPLLEALPLLVLLGTFGVWLVRTEMRVRTNTRDIEILEKRIERERADTQKDFDDIKDLLQEQNRDIKILLGRGHVQHWNDRTIPPR